jgi:hypothetical protein
MLTHLNHWAERALLAAVTIGAVFVVAYWLTEPL